MAEINEYTIEITKGDKTFEVDPLSCTTNSLATAGEVVLIEHDITFIDENGCYTTITAQNDKCRFKKKVK